jgi:hypothetical protein
MLVVGGVTVVIRDLTLGKGIQANTLVVNGSMPTVELENVTIMDDEMISLQTAILTARNLKMRLTTSAFACIDAHGEVAGSNGATANRGSMVTIDGSRFDAPGGSIVLSGNSTARIANSVFRNSTPDTTVAHAVGGSTGGPSSISFSTLHNVGIKCSVPLTVRNTIVLNERSDAPTNVVPTSTTCETYYSLLKPQAAAPNGANNKQDLDPRFVNGANGDYYLLAGSPAIDAADPNATEPVDLEGTVRPQGAGRDMGAFEYKP